jgi:hypothetical protein
MPRTILRRDRIVAVVALASAAIILATGGTEAVSAAPLQRNDLEFAPYERLLERVVDRNDAAIFSYRGYRVDLSKIAGRPDVAAIAQSLRHQLDIVETVGLNPRILAFFHSVPISAAEGACRDFSNSPACYTPPSVVRMNPVTFEAQRPVMLHEFLHAYHGKLMPQGFQNRDVLFYYDRARTAQLYPAGEYLLTNHREFFAMTASVFLYGQAAREPFTRSNLKQKQPIYYQYLVRLFGFDPDDATARR